MEKKIDKISPFTEDELDMLIKMNDKQIEVDKNIFADQIKKGLGENIINYIGKQQKISLLKRFGIKLGYYIRTFFKLFG
jgi:sulfur relay (sulfurtransferase) DsrC/TusE family protein